MSKLKLSLSNILMYCVIGLLSITNLKAINSSDQKVVLCITSYGTEPHYIREEMASFVAESARNGNAYVPVIESMECLSMNNANEWQGKMERILMKYPNPYAIILLGNEAAITYFSMEDEEYRKIPLYVLQCNDELAVLPEKYGIPSVKAQSDGERIRKMVDISKGFNVRYIELTDYGIKQNIDLIQRLYGNDIDVAVLTDNTYTGLCIQYCVRIGAERAKRWDFHYIDGREMDMATALAKVRDLPPHTVMLLGGWRVDKNEATFLSNAVYAFSNVKNSLLMPVVTISGLGLGYWSLGGFFPQMDDVQKGLVEFFRHDVETQMTGKTEMKFTPMAYVFDEQVCKSLQIAKEELPKQATYINVEVKPLDVFNEYKWEICTVIVLIIILTLAVIIISIYSIRNKKLASTLKNSQIQLLEEKRLLEQSEHHLRIAKKRAEEASMAKTYFISNMSHEIRTPLNAIVGFSQVLVEMVKDQSGISEYANIVLTNSETLVKLVDGLLEISDIQSGKAQFDITQGDIIYLLEGLVENLRPMAKEGVELRFESKYKQLELNSDFGRIVHVMTALMDNAMKFTEQGSITVKVEKDSGKQMVLISVTDTGSGVPDNIRKVLFDRFEKPEEFVQGSGMSLTICQSIVEALGGRIWLDEFYRDGAQFCFTLPID